MRLPNRPIYVPPTAKCPSCGRVYGVGQPCPTEQEAMIAAETKRAIRRARDLAMVGA